MGVLQEKKAELTIKLLLDAACELSETLEISELSFKKVADQAQISQRTMFRYFRTREEFLDALATRLHSELDLPEAPEHVDLLIEFVASFYQKLEAQPRKVMLLLSADLFPRILNTSAKTRFEALQQLLRNAYPNATTDIIMKTAANLRYVISATSWRYYRVHYDFDLATSIECAQMMLSQTLEYMHQHHE